MSSNFNEKFESRLFRDLIIILTLMIVFSSATTKCELINIKMSFIYMFTMFIFVQKESFLKFA
jgi:hypothetical protein